MMRVQSRSGPVRLLLSLALLLAAPPASAFPITYTAGGTLSGVGGGGDPINLGFSTVRITLYADTADLPTGVTSDATSIRARYKPSSGFLSFTNRLRGAADLTIPYTPDLITVNAFEGSGSPDTFELDQGTTTGVPGASLFYVGGFRLSFIDASFFPGSAAGPLPGFDVTGGTVIYGVFYDLDRSGLYEMSAPFLRKAPEPGSALLVAAGILALLARRSAR